MRMFSLWLLGTDGLCLLLYGLLSLLTPGASGEVYLSSSRWMYGVIPAALGATSAVIAVWACIVEVRKR